MLVRLVQLAVLEGKALEVRRVHQGPKEALEIRELQGQKETKVLLAMKAQLELKAMWDQPARQGQLATEVLLEQQAVKALLDPQVSRGQQGWQAATLKVLKGQRDLRDSCCCSWMRIALQRLPNLLLAQQS